MGGVFHPRFVLGWTTAMGEERAPRAFALLPMVDLALCQRNKTPGCARMYKVNQLTPTTMRHLRVSQSLAEDCLFCIREDFGLMQLLHGKQQKQTRNTH